MIGACTEEDDAAAPVKITGADGKEVSLDGTWETECLPSNFNDQGVAQESKQDTMVIAGSTATVTGLEYNAPECVAAELRTTSVANLSLTADTGTTKATLTDLTDNTLEAVDAARFTISASSVTVAFATETAATEAAGACGVETFTKDKPEELPLDCEHVQMDKPWKSIFYVDNTGTKEVLYMDMENWASGTDSYTNPLDADDYPTELDPYMPYTKK